LHVGRANPAHDPLRVDVVAAWNVGIDEAQRPRRKKHSLREHGLPLDLGLSRVGKVSRRVGQTSARAWGSGSGAVKVCASFRHAPRRRRRVAHVEPLQIGQRFTMRHLMICCRARFFPRFRRSAFPTRKVAL
jgi:hypothetical protein